MVAAESVSCARFLGAVMAPRCADEKIALHRKKVASAKVRLRAILLTRDNRLPQSAAWDVSCCCRVATLRQLQIEDCKLGIGRKTRFAFSNLQSAIGGIYNREPMPAIALRSFA